MGDISNKSLAALLVVAIVVSVAGTWLVVNNGPGLAKLTGGVADTGTASMTISTTASIMFEDDAVAFGAVGVDVGQTTCTLDTSVGGADGTGCKAGFTAETDGFTIQNDGNKDLIVDLNVSNNAAGFFGGTGAVYQYKGNEVEVGSCATPSYSGGYTDVNTSNPQICDNLDYTDASDEIHFDVKVVVPYDATAGAKSSTWTATGTAI